MSMNTKPTTGRNGFQKSTYLLPMIAVLAAGLACGAVDGGPNPSNNPREFILDEATEVQIWNFTPYLEADELPGVMLKNNEDTIDRQDELREEWELEELGLTADDITIMTTVHTNNGTYYVFKGEFDFNDPRNSLEDDDYKEDTYRNFEIWEKVSEHDATAVALFEGSGIIVGGDKDAIKEVLKAMDRGEGFIDAESNLRRALEAAGEGIIGIADSDCNLSVKDVLKIKSLPGCEAAGVTIAGGDEATSQVTIAAVFRSERRAETGMEDLKEAIEGSKEVDADVEDTQLKGDLIVMKLTIHE